MYPAQVETVAFRAIAGVRLEVEVGHQAVLAREGVHGAGANGEHSLAATRYLVPVEFGIGDLVEPVAVDAGLELGRERV
ncbi:hypothetical protein D3C86_1925440 [compost metagenome]